MSTLLHVLFIRQHIRFVPQMVIKAPKIKLRESKGMHVRRRKTEKQTLTTFMGRTFLIFLEMGDRIFVFYPEIFSARIFFLTCQGQNPIFSVPDFFSVKPLLITKWILNVQDPKRIRTISKQNP